MGRKTTGFERESEEKGNEGRALIVARRYTDDKVRGERRRESDGTSWRVGREGEEEVSV